MTDFLLNPDIVYLFLVAGLFLALLAIITPGTGILEISAIFAFLLTGWGIYQLPINSWAIFVMAAGIIPFLLALKRIRTSLSLVTSILLLLFGSIFLFKGETWWKPAVNIPLALITSLIVGLFFWIAASKILQAETKEPAHDLKKLIGAIGEARTDIHQEGTVYLAGELWSAYSQVPIPKGSLVRVLQREGLTLKVVPVESEKEQGDTPPE